MKFTEDTKYEWCLNYCKLHNLDPFYYRDWEIAEEEYLEYRKNTSFEQLVNSIYNPSVS